MGRIMQAEGRVAFRDDDQAGRFAAELRERHGQGIVKELAAGRTEALAGDVGDETERHWVTRAIMSAAKVHAAFGFPLRQAQEASCKFAGPMDRSNGTDWER